ncbi:MAG: signal peptidase I [Chloroflexi bacterium]|nr:signal peptidase I [Chloroflexota bacterium]
MYEVAAQPESAPAAPLPRPAIRRWDALREVVELVVLICAIYALVNLSTVRFIVQGPSMEPNFETGQFLIVSRVNYLLGDPQRGDIVVFHYPGNPDEDYIKRVIGLPGDVIEFRGQQVYVNGQLLNEPYINEACSEDMCADRRWELGPDEYFVMGDNRNRSSDSRRFGPVPRTFIVGEVLIRYWPPEDWGIVHQIAYPAGNP